MTVRKQREEIQQMFDSLDPQSRRIAVRIAQKFGRRFAFRYIVRTSKEQQHVVLPSKNRGFLIGIFYRIRGWMRSVFVGDDSEGDSRNLILSRT